MLAIRATSCASFLLLPLVFLAQGCRRPQCILRGCLPCSKHKCTNKRRLAKDRRVGGQACQNICRQCHSKNEKLRCLNKRKGGKGDEAGETRAKRSKRDVSPERYSTATVAAAVPETPIKVESVEVDSPPAAGGAPVLLSSPPAGGPATAPPLPSRHPVGYGAFGAGQSRSSKAPAVAATAVEEAQSQAPAFNWGAWEVCVRNASQGLSKALNLLSADGACGPAQPDTLAFCQLLAGRAAMASDPDAALMLHITMGMLGRSTAPANSGTDAVASAGGASRAGQPEGKKAPAVRRPGLKRRSMASQGMLYM